MRLRRKPYIKEAIKEYQNFTFLAGSDLTAKKGKWQQEFATHQPLMVELGTGKGSFISGMAAAFPEYNFIGIEKEPDVLFGACKKVAAAVVPNVRLLVFNVEELATIFAPGEISGIYLNFSDPWPKVRHAKRRLTHRRFLEVYRTLLASGGKIYFKTDNRSLFDFSLEEFQALDCKIEELTYDLHSENTFNIMTEYEARFSALGQKINRCVVSFK